jgi:hypothetical protein
MTPAAPFPWEAEPFRLWSVVDMERFYTGLFLASVAQYSRHVGMLLERLGSPTANQPLEADTKESIHSAVSAIAKTFPKDVPFSDVIVQHLARIQSYLEKDSTFPVSEESALYITKDFLENLETELRTHLFLYVPSSRKEMFTNPEKWFWGDITERVRGTEIDIEEACRCHALGRSTATVSHLMRVAEIGLRSLAKTAKVTIKKKDRTLPYLWADWQELITAIRAKKVTGMQTVRGPKRDAELDFYQGALGEFESFKVVYRHHAMHARKSYKEPEAEHVMLYVRGFMRRLAPRTR